MMNSMGSGKWRLHLCLIFSFSLLEATVLADGFVLPKPHGQPTKPMHPLKVANSPTLHALETLRGGWSQKKVEVAMNSNNFLRGKLLLLAHKLFVSPAQYSHIFFERIVPNTYWPELALIIAMCSSLPISKGLYKMRPSKQGLAPETFAIIYKGSKQLKLARIVQQVGLLQAILYLSDVILVFLKLLDFEFVVKYKAQQVAGPIILSLWLAYNASRLKYHWMKNGFTLSSVQHIRKQQIKEEENAKMRKMEEVDANNDGQPKIVGYNRFVNRVLDVMIWMCAFISVIEILGVEIGFALKSVFGIGSFGTLVLSLASKDVAAEFVGGLMIQSSNFFEEGEMVSLQDGTTGKVVRIGWLHTFVDKTGDNYIVRVPNSQIAHQRVARPRRIASGRGRNKF